MDAKNLTKTEKKRLNELFDKILNSRDKLSKGEIKELEKLKKKLESVHKEKLSEPEPFSEVSERVRLITNCELALKTQEKVELEELPTEKRLDKLNSKVDSLIEEYQKKQRPSKEEKDKKAKEDFEKFYADYEAKWGTDYKAPVRISHSDAPEMDEDMEKLYEEYEKKFGKSL